MSDDEDAHLLRGVKRLKQVKLTCTNCGNVRVEKRGYPIGLWKVIAKKDKLPPTVGMLCEKCCELSPHFVDWPDDAEKK